MNISTKTRYGFRLMIYLGINEETNETIQLGEIAEKENISLKYLEKIVQILKRGGLVSVKRGPKGGYKLAKPARSISLLEVYENLEGSASVTDCADSDECKKINGCSTASLWKGLSKVISDYLGSKTLDDIINENKDRDSMFYI
ncbi:MAG: Rrf2 family transcriptional regulator [Spirochaetales bacterium]|nr:Rrf2 family transcriptional regulator [Spirochaetales bacterium]